MNSDKICEQLTIDEKIRLLGAKHYREKNGSIEKFTYDILGRLQGTYGGLQL